MIERFAATGFRNLKEVDLSLNARLVVFFGDNGQGKTNLLEGISLLSSLKSFRGAKAHDLIGRDEQAAALQLSLGSPGTLSESRSIYMTRAGTKTTLINQKPERRRVTWQRRMPMVIFHPQSLSLAQGSPEVRRSLLDEVLSNLNPAYDKALTDYERALRQRNRLLKEEEIDLDAVRAFNGPMIDRGMYLISERKEACVTLANLAEPVFHKVSGARRHLSVVYSPRVDLQKESLADALSRSLNLDTKRGFTAEGPHADDIHFLLDGDPMKTRASQGQQRLLALSIKVAEAQMIAAKTDRSPLILLDDVSSELDRTRNERFFDVLAEVGSQTVLTTTHPEYIRRSNDRQDFEVVEGTVTPR